MVIRMRHTKAHTRNRRSHHALTKGAIVTDKKTGTSHMRHRVCMITGTYKGKQVLKKTTTTTKSATETQGSDADAKSDTKASDTDAKATVKKQAKTKKTAA